MSKFANNPYEVSTKLTEKAFIEARKDNRTSFNCAIYRMNSLIERSEKVYGFSEEIGFSKGLTTDIKDNSKSIKDSANRVSELMDEMAALVNTKYINLVEEELFYFITEINETENFDEDGIDKFFEIVLRKISKKDREAIEFQILERIECELRKIFRD